MVHFVPDEVESLHLTPTRVGCSTSGHALGKSLGSPCGPFCLSPCEVLLVALKDLVGTELGELSDVFEG